MKNLQCLVASKNLLWILSLFLFLILVHCAMPASGYTQGKGAAIGIMLGEPTGIDVKKWTNGNIGLTASVGFLTSGILHKYFPYQKPGEFRDKVHMQIAGHFLYHFFFGRTRVFPVYVGAGLRFKIFFDDSKQSTNKDYAKTDKYLINSNDPLSFGFRFLLGTEYIIKTPTLKWSIYLESAINVSLVPTTGGWPRVTKKNGTWVLLNSNSSQGFFFPDWGANLGVRWYFQR